MSLHENVNQYFKNWQYIIKLYRGGGVYLEENGQEEEDDNNTTAAHFDVLAESITKLMAFKSASSSDQNSRQEAIYST